MLAKIRGFFMFWGCLAATHVGSELHDQGLKPHAPLWKAKS